MSGGEGIRTPGFFRAREVPRESLTGGNALLFNGYGRFWCWLIASNAGRFAAFRVQNASWKALLEDPGEMSVGSPRLHEMSDGFVAGPYTGGET